MTALVSRLVGLEPKKGKGKRKIKGDGFGQSLIDDIRFASRFRKMKRKPVAWREPGPAEKTAILADPMLGRFADEVVALGEHEGLACVVLERLRYGYPDPPRYVLFAADEGQVRIAADFDRWPRRWGAPPAAGRGT